MALDMPEKKCSFLCWPHRARWTVLSDVSSVYLQTCQHIGLVTGSTYYHIGHLFLIFEKKRQGSEIFDSDIVP